MVKLFFILGGKHYTSLPYHFLLNSIAGDNMPNWCYTVVAFTGDASNLNEFYCDFMKAQNTITEGSKGWIGKLLVYKGIDWEKIYCRGFYEDIQLESDHVMFYSMDAWGPCTEVYDEFSKLYNLSYVLKAEEPGNMVYINTDVEGRFFPEKYIFDAYNLDLLRTNDTQLLNIFYDLTDIQYFEAIDQILSFFKDYKKRDIKTLEDFKNLIREYDDYVMFAEFTNEI